MSDDDWNDEPTTTYNYSEIYEKNDSGSRGRGRGSRGRGSFRGGRGGGFGSSNGYSDNDRDNQREGGFRRGGRGRGRGGGRWDRDRDGSDDENGGGGGYRGERGQGDSNEAGEKKPGPVTYVPPEDDSAEALFHAGISSGINFSKYDSIEIKVTGENAPKPIMDFESCGMRDLLLENIRKSGYTVPTPVQKNAIPIISAKRDLMACAQTGSGKTAAFLLPIINNMLIEKPSNVAGVDCCVEPNCVIVSPTRELCLQIFDEARKFANGSILKIAKLYGGVQVSHQAQRLLGGCHILVATPGRLLDFVNRGRVKFSSLKYFVLDEADRMLDLGFLPDVKRMLQHESMVPCGERVTLMFSATFPHEVQQLAGEFLHNYLFLAVGIVGGACSDVDQHIYQVSKFDKREKLIEIMEARSNQNELTLVFVQTKRNADFIAIYLCENNFKTTSIHGDRFQSQREDALRDFKRGKMPTLVATAVAARGLDIKNVAHVINFDLPQSIDEYVHRIGRTGRVGNKGKATSFYDPNDDRNLAKDLVKILEQAGQEVPSFLLSEAGDSFDDGGGLDSFGGTDIRGDNGGQFRTSSVPVPIEDEEFWG